MGAAGYLTRRPHRRGDPAEGDPDAPSGPAAATLHTVAMRTAALVRSIGIGYVLVQLVIWRTFCTAQPARLAVRWHKAA